VTREITARYTGKVSTMTAQAAVTGTPTRPRRMLRPVIVPPSLLDLHGPWIGVLELPQRLCWSLDAEQRRFDLADLDRVASAYEYVLDAALTSSPFPMKTSMSSVRRAEIPCASRAFPPPRAAR
jgi:hypothetical protein